MIVFFSNIRLALQDWWFPRNQVHVLSVLAINNLDPHEPDGHVEWIDLTPAYKTGLDLRERCEDLTDFRIEYRYRYNHQKYRYVVDGNAASIDVPDAFPSPPGFARRPMFAWLCFPDGTEEPVVSKLQKYGGPNGDFYGGKTVRAQWMFPWWTKDSFDDAVLRIMDTHMHWHEVNMGSNPYLDLA